MFQGHQRRIWRKSRGWISSWLTQWKEEFKFRLKSRTGGRILSLEKEIIPKPREVNVEKPWKSRNIATNGLKVTGRRSMRRHAFIMSNCLLGFLFNGSYYCCIYKPFYTRLNGFLLRRHSLFVFQRQTRFA